MVATMDAERAAMSTIEVMPETLRGWLEQGEAVVVDVREPFEYSEGRVEDSDLVPLSSVEVGTLRDRHGATRIVFLCKTGQRATEAANRFREAGETAYVLTGGIEGWKAAGRPVVLPAGPTGLPVMRQVQIVAGSLVASGTALGVLVSPWFFVVPGFVGCGLVFAGSTGWCGMAKLLGAMPWNKRPACGAS